ncbi:MAG: molecular chaperone DnaJ [Gammaproteobacteria bacterium]|nr:molecular chaperone DnaJ [Gammaproteobacteria bacterium]MCP5423682.1 molecular chaperone DnaJ [Gammaproteobacteria bacterium]
MCNPRRVTVTLTRDIAEAWRREISRSVELAERITGEARARQNLSAQLGGPALKALEARLTAGEEPAWRETAEGYRCDVDGGYVLYRLDEQVLEIVAARDETVAVRGQAATVLTGEVRETLETQATSGYYHDGYGGRTEAVARKDAEEIARQQLEEERQARLTAVQRQAESAAGADLQQRAQADAQSRLEQATAERQAELARQAEQHLEAVGVRCRQAFNELLARAYRDAILAYARRHGAENISCKDDDGVMEIEFFVDR